MDFGWPNAEIGQKMANGQLLFLALDSSINKSDPPIPNNTIYYKDTNYN